MTGCIEIEVLVINAPASMPSLQLQPDQFIGSVQPDRRGALLSSLLPVLFFETEVSFNKSRRVSKNFKRSAGQSVLEVWRAVLEIGMGTETGSLALLQPRLR